MKIYTEDELREALDERDTAAESLQAQLNDLPADVNDDDKAALERKFEENVAEVAKLSEALDRKAQLKQARERRPQADRDEQRADYGSRPRTKEEFTYRPGGPASFFKDVLHGTQFNDPNAQSRLAKHMREMTMEGRVMDTTSSSGLGVVAPQYLQDLWAALARAGRPLADAIGPRPLPASGTIFNVPRVTTGASVTVQATEGGAVADNTDVIGTVQFSIETVAGKVDMSRQAFDRSDPALEMVIGEDLAAAYALSVDSEIINGPGSGGKVKGILNATGVNAVTYTQATPTAATLYPKVADAIQRVDTNRFFPADLIVMHPRRWAALIGAVDSQNRPLVVPDAPIVPSTQAVNVMADVTRSASQGLRGYMQGIPVLTDASLPTTGGAGTNQDAVIVTRKEDLLLFESSGGPTIQVMQEVLSGTLQVRILAWGYIAFTAERYPTATSLITGTGLVAPTF